MGLAEFEPDDPDLAIPHGALQNGIREAPERYFAANHNGLITYRPAEPLGPKPARSLERKWKLALIASCVFHAAVALFFVLSTDEAVLMEGAEFSGIAFLGDGADQVKAGDISETEEPAVDVTMVTMLEARPVKTVEAETIPVEKAVEATDVETLEPVREPPVEQVSEAKAEPAQPAERTELEPVESKPAPAVSETVPEVLATDRVEQVEDNTVQKPAETLAAEPAETVEATQPESSQGSEATKTEQTESTKAEPSETKPVEPVEAKPVEKAAPQKPIKEAQKKAAEKQTAKPEKADAKPRKSGNGGQNQTNARRGQADGQEKGDSRQASRGGSKNGEVGNAAVSNYPGKVRSKLARIARSVRAKGRGEVIVAFAVGSNGGVRSARVARSSGVASVDKAALQAIRKASPFPPIPANAGRSTWEFSIPLAFMR
jgi:protein TonB